MDPFDIWFWPWTVAGRGASVARVPAEAEPQWASQNCVELDLEAMRLRDFSTAAGGEAAALVVAPFALHDAALADLSPGYSLIEALRLNGCARVFLLEWKAATLATKLRTIDSCFCDLNVAVDELGPPVDLIGLCQGGWLALIYAARFPQKVRRLALVGAPIDIAAEPSIFSAWVSMTPPALIAGLIRRGDGLALGEIIKDLWPLDLDELALAAEALQFCGAPKNDGERAALRNFLRWRRHTLDLPGPYYAQVVEWLFRENRIAAGCFSALGRIVDLRLLRRPLFLLAGARDRIAPVKQALAAAALTGAKPEEIETAVAPCGHLALFMGRDTMKNQWPRVARWLAK